ncbi:MAG: DUF4846 domain-containing protein [Acidobacteriota bacterium]
MAAAAALLLLPIPAAADTVAERFPPPDGYARVDADAFGRWLRKLPLLPGRPEVHLHDGRPKANQSAHLAVIDLDVGRRDLQQCADLVIRLRAEFLKGAGCDDQVAFDFTSGDRARWSDYRTGVRPKIDGNRVSWGRSASADASDASFRRYLDLVFTYAGTLSLKAELEPVADPAEVEVGDVFIQGGSPGHAVLVADVAENDAGRRVFLLVQSYMPAQQAHVLRGPTGRVGDGPWYEAKPSGPLRTPEWRFEHGDLRRFPATPGCAALR